MTTSMKTFSPKPRDIERRWYVLDADGAVLGRLASEAAKILRGKHKPIFAPHADTGDHVIVINAGRVRVTGGKESEKTYYRHSGYPGGLREIGYERLLAERPTVAVEKAIRGMLPKNRLGRQVFRKLAVYEGAEHPHQAQKPAPLRLGEIPRWDGLPVAAPAPEAIEPSEPPRPRKPAAKAASGPAAPTAARRSATKAATSRSTTPRAKAGRGSKAAPAAKSTAGSKSKRSTSRKAATKKSARSSRRSKPGKES
jgi:large subunit ribosomal protein L13